MRRATILTVRALIACLLLAALFDLHVTAGSRARNRLHLIDRSASVLIEGPANSLAPEDVRPLIESAAADHGLIVAPGEFFGDDRSAFRIGWTMPDDGIDAGLETLGEVLTNPNATRSRAT